MPDKGLLPERSLESPKSLAPGVRIRPPGREDYRAWLERWELCVLAERR
jgi:hypothetical protein